MAVAQRFTVSTTAVLLSTRARGDSNIAAAGAGGTRLIIRNTNTTATETLSLGGSGVTSGNGFLLAGGAQIEVNLDSGESIYAVRGAAVDVAVHVLAAG